MKTTIVAGAAAVVLAASVATAGQQTDSTTDPSGSWQSEPSAGWTLTPSLVTSRTYDDNVLLRGPGDPLLHDYVNVMNPRGDLAYRGKRTEFTAQYDGAFVLYSDLTTLNSYAQNGGVSAKHKLSKRNSFFFTGNATAAPTTELLQLNGIPYVRAGVFADDVRAGIETLVSKRATITVDGHFTQARFDASGTDAALLQGGNAIGGDFSYRYRLSERTTLTADADALHATIGTAEQVFDIQHAVAGIDRQLTEGIHVFGAGGFSRLGVTAFGPPRTGPSWKLGYVERIRTTVIDVTYDRSYVPSFGFGGTTQNGSLTARIHLPITRRIYTQDLVSVQQQDPIVIAVPQLRSYWLQAAVGYAARPWVRIEAYFTGTRQTAGVPDALLQHNQVGVQIVASKPMRIR